MSSIIVRDITSLNDSIKECRKLESNIVLVPTMGAIHKGHIELINRAIKISSATIVSIFVNPLQFSDNEDLNSYPKDQKKDIDLLKKLNVKIIYLPSANKFYTKDFTTSVSIGNIGNILCGESRPNHFNGVTTVLTKLFFQVQPDIAIFGEKDFQQLQIIRKLVNDLDIKCNIEGVPTVREKDGLAYSSRNIKLSDKQRHTASNLYRIINFTANRIYEGETIDKACKKAIKAILDSGFDKVDYLHVVEETTLSVINKLNSNSRILVAAYLGNTRLIDNIKIKAQS